MNKKEVIVVGAGLSGVEIAYKLAQNNIKVFLYEKKRINRNEVQRHDGFAELVCSNSLRSNSLTNGVGLLKYEMELQNSLVIKAAKKTQVPAGGALAVDREQFSNFITKEIINHKNITLIEEDFVYDKNIHNNKIVVIATGPLTSDKLSNSLQNILGKEYFYFFDAAAPIITKESINFEKAYYKSRYDKGDSADYINCPMTKEEYNLWYKEVVNAKTVALKDFEKAIYFEGCMPFEVMAKKGEKSLLFGPMKPVGLAQDVNNKPFAVVQLRQDNVMASLYNIVGFQTNLKFPEQKRIIQMIPGLENANIVRYGVIHKNNFINTPILLNDFLQLNSNDNIYFAGQITGVEGYVESAATGLYVAQNIINRFNEKESKKMPINTMTGSLIHYIRNANPDNFQPMKANFGIIPSANFRFKSKEEKYIFYSERAIKDIKNFLNLV